MPTSGVGGNYSNLGYLTQTSTDDKAAANIGNAMDSAEKAYLEKLGTPNASQSELMQAQMKYQKAQMIMQTFQQMIQNKYQMLRNIVQNGLSIR